MTRLNDTVLTEELVHDDIAELLYEIGAHAAINIFRDVETHADRIWNPTGYVRKAAKNALRRGTSHSPNCFDQALW